MGSVQAAIKYMITPQAVLEQNHQAMSWQCASISILVYSSIFTFTPALSCRLHNVKRLHTSVEKESGVVNRPIGPSDYQVLNSNQSARSPSSDPNAVHTGPAAR